MSIAGRQTGSVSSGEIVVAGDERRSLHLVDPETDIPPEFLPRDYGFEHEFIGMPLRSVNMLRQVRHDRNDQQGNLKKSIEEIGMMAFPEIARFDDASYLAYARVIAEREGVEYTDEELFSWVNRHEDGLIYVLISGHSRTLAIIDNEAERSIAALEAGYNVDPLDAIVKMTVRDNPTPDEMLLRQISENLHSRPAAEHIAADVLSLHRYYVANNMIDSEKDLFDKFGDKLPESTFDTIMNFGNLPLDVQQMAFSDTKFPFTTAAKIGALAPHKRALETYKVMQHPLPSGKLRTRLTQKQAAKIDEAVEGFLKLEYVSLATAVHGSRRFPIGLQSKRLDRVKLDILNALDNEGTSLFGTELADWGMTPEQIIQEQIDKQKAELREALETLNRTPIEHLDKVVAAHAKLAGVALNPNSVRSRNERLFTTAQGIIGAVGLQETVELKA